MSVYWLSCIVRRWSPTAQIIPGMRGPLFGFLSWRWFPWTTQSISRAVKQIKKPFQKIDTANVAHSTLSMWKWKKNKTGLVSSYVYMCKISSSAYKQGRFDIPNSPFTLALNKKIWSQHAYTRTKHLIRIIWDLRSCLIFQKNQFVFQNFLYLLIVPVFVGFFFKNWTFIVSSFCC